MSNQIMTFNHENNYAKLEKQHMWFQLEGDDESEASDQRRGKDDKALSDYTNYKDRFPLKLYNLLQQSSQDGFEDIVSWYPCGTMFRIHDQKKFVAEVMPNFFPGMNCFKSFRRQLNLYGINQSVAKRVHQEKRLLGGSGAYAHPFLIRNHRELCSRIQRSYHETPEPKAPRTISTISSKENNQQAEYILELEQESRVLREAFQVTKRMSSLAADAEQRLGCEPFLDTTSSATTTRTNPCPCPCFFSSSASSSHSGCFIGGSSGAAGGYEGDGFDEGFTVGINELQSTRNKNNDRLYVQHDNVMSKEEKSIIMMAAGVNVRQAHGKPPAVVMNYIPSQQDIYDEIIRTFLEQH